MYIKKPRAEWRGFLALKGSPTACFGLPVLFLLQTKTMTVLCQGKSHPLFSRGNPFERGNLADRSNPQPFRNSQSSLLPAE
jgi:hypothetical protein